VALLGVYSDPRRDPRGHTISAVYVGRARGQPRADDDAADVGVFTESNLPQPMAFDHARILEDYFHYRRTGSIPKPAS
jgi:8-oxo-dGTP diphosphatase